MTFKHQAQIIYSTKSLGIKISLVKNKYDHSIITVGIFLFPFQFTREGSKTSKVFEGKTHLNKLNTFLSLNQKTAGSQWPLSFPPLLPSSSLPIFLLPLLSLLSLHAFLSPPLPHLTLSLPLSVSSFPLVILFLINPPQNPGPFFLFLQPSLLKPAALPKRRRSSSSTPTVVAMLSLASISPKSYWVLAMTSPFSPWAMRPLIR